MEQIRVELHHRLVAGTVSPQFNMNQLMVCIAYFITEENRVTEDRSTRQNGMAVLPCVFFWARQTVPYNAIVVMHNERRQDIVNVSFSM